MDNQPLIPEEIIVNKIYLIRGEKVMLDSDLAQLYNVEVRRLKEAVRRNHLRFPDDFLFELTQVEFNSLRSQFATLKRGKHSKYLPFAFTEQGIAMLSSVLHSEESILVNIAIMRAFVQVRKFMETHKEFARKLEDLERTVAKHDERIQLVFQAIKDLIEKKIEPPPPRTTIGYRIGPPPSPLGEGAGG